MLTAGIELGELESQRSAVVRILQELVVLDNRRDQNQPLFDAMLLDPPPIADQNWGRVAFLAGLYGRHAAQVQLSAEQTATLWTALVWTVAYEQHFRLRNVKCMTERLSDFWRFARACRNDAYVAEAAAITCGLLDELKAPTLREICKLLSPIKAAPDVRELLKKIEERIVDRPGPRPELVEEGSEHERVRVAIRKLWFLLDRQRQAWNEEEFNKAVDGTDPVARRVIAKLAGIIIKNAVYRYRTGTPLAGEQLDGAVLLAGIAARDSEGDFAAPANFNHVLLEAVRDIRHGAVDRADLVRDLKAVSERFPAAGDFVEAAWGTLVSIVTRYLDARQQLGASDRPEADGWVDVLLTNKDSLEKALAKDQLRREAISEFLSKAKAYGASENFAFQQLSQLGQPEAPKTADFINSLSEENRRELLASIKKSKFPVLTEILRRERQLLLTLSRALSQGDPSFSEYLPPRRPLKLQAGSTEDLFPKARKLLMNTKEDDWAEAVRIFEGSLPYVTHRDYKALAQEWLLYAKAKANGPFYVVQDWVERIDRHEASWEEVWNLAVCYLQAGSDREIFKALELLAPGVDNGTAPFSHLRFSLYCGILLLEHFEGQVKESAQYRQPVDFLIRNVIKLPVAECYLAWLLLVTESQRDISVIEQMNSLRTFDLISQQPVRILQPEVGIPIPT